MILALEAVLLSSGSTTGDAGAASGVALLAGAVFSALAALAALVALAAIASSRGGNFGRCGILASSLKILSAIMLEKSK